MTEDRFVGLFLYGKVACRAAWSGLCGETAEFPLAEIRGGCGFAAPLGFCLLAKAGFAPSDG
ncbi:MAG: hypothetical protein K2N36_07805 [Ruminiclostridium sp.]|nr:hypothetical protein [Ruminiclostridium sp.]